MECPCKDCEFKGCGELHDTCKSYKIWREEFQRLKDIKNSRFKEDLYFEHIYKRRH